MFISIIPEIRDADITAKFAFTSLTPIVGKPTYEKMDKATRQLVRNVIAIKVGFGGEGKGGAWAKYMVR